MQFTIEVPFNGTIQNYSGLARVNSKEIFTLIKPVIEKYRKKKLIGILWLLDVTLVKKQGNKLIKIKLITYEPWWYLPFKVFWFPTYNTATFIKELPFKEINNYIINLTKEQL